VVSGRIKAIAIDPRDHRRVSRQALTVASDPTMLVRPGGRSRTRGSTTSLRSRRHDHERPQAPAGESREETGDDRVATGVTTVASGIVLALSACNETSAPPPTVHPPADTVLALPVAESFEGSLTQIEKH
jgi:hypothetical protein